MQYFKQHHNLCLHNVLKAQTISVETEQCTALSLSRSSQSSSPSTLLSLSLSLILRQGTALYAMQDRLDTS